MLIKLQFLLFLMHKQLSDIFKLIISPFSYITENTGFQFPYSLFALPKKLQESNFTQMHDSSFWRERICNRNTELVQLSDYESDLSYLLSILRTSSSMTLHVFFIAWCFCIKVRVIRTF
jgi:hypothetical protein